MPTFRIPGVAEATPRPSLLNTVEGVRPQQRVRVESGRASSQLQDVNGEFAEILLTGGVRLWGATDTLSRDLATGSSRSGIDDVPVWGVRLGGGEGSRGAGKDLAVQVVETFDLQIVGTIRDFIKDKVETGMEAGGLLRQCVTSNASAFNEATKINGQGPTLVFIHGTASSTEGSFGGLWDAVGGNRVLRIDNPGARINEIFKAYENRVFGFEHRSLSESPIVNAEALMKQLVNVVPGGRELHLVSHSRGGMIGELLCRGMRQSGDPIDNLDLDQFRDDAADRQNDRDKLLELGRLLKEQGYKIGRFARVACPAAGTSLADGRLDRYLSVLVNVAGLVTGLGADPLYKALTNLLAAVLKERTDPKTLPGLEAMMPKSPLTRLLNRRDVLTAADLHVLGGDLAVRGFWSALKALATDFFFLEDHDLVVNTPSMLRGTPRAGGVKYFIDTDDDVSHFNYFRRADTADRLAGLLTSGSAEFRNLEVQPFDVDGKSYRKRDGAPMPALVFIPGFMGSHLSNAGGRLWADPARLAQGSFNALSAKEGIVPDGLVGVYTDLITQLSASHGVVPFPYDWRLSAAENADELSKLLTKLLADKWAEGQPIRILTHGAGGLVLHALIASNTGRKVWDALLARRDARAVMLGYPAEGTVHALLPLLYRGALLEGLASIDLKNRERDLVSIFAGFDGLLELLPGSVPSEEPAGWFARGQWIGPFEAPEGLAKAHAFRRKLAATPLDNPQILHVTGTASATPLRVSVDKSEVAIEATPDGDGYSAWAEVPAALRERCWLAATDHGGLIAAKEMWPAIVELLGTGGTRRLGRLKVPDIAPLLRPAVLRSLSAIPSDAELVASGLGISARSQEIPRPKVRVRVLHGSLSRVKAPVVVGHYDQDVLANAEAYLDRQLDQRLTHLRAMRRYPGPIGSSAVELQPDVDNIKHPGAIVVGLGTVGTLTAGGLIRTVEEGLTAYGVEKLSEYERQASGAADRGPRPRTISAPVTSLLVGSGEAGLSLRDSVHGLLRAVIGANDRLAKPAAIAAKSGSGPVPITARIETLDLIELYEDRAVEALRILRPPTPDAEFADSFEIDPVLRIGEEGRQRVSFEEAAAWWQRLRVSEHPASLDPQLRTARTVLKFEAYDERARIDAYAVSSQRELAKAFIDDALKTTASNDRVGRTLFEMLVPNDIKYRSPDRRDTVLLLDTAAAAIPWELLEDSLQGDGRPRQPLAIEAGLVRQLVDDYPPRHVRQATGDRALVIGNPLVGDPQFPDLPGAQREAEAVAGQLAPRFNVESLVSGAATPKAILSALHEQPWRVLHLAMHGVFNFPDVKHGNTPVTGVVVGSNVFLEPADFNQMRYVPELVFLNCCHVGFTGGEHVPRHPELAANLATQFIKMGARAVIAAGWAVHDQAAESFARVFYSSMLDGEHFGEATKLARQAIHRQFPQYNTWGAYQCYGDPAFVLATGRADGRQRPPVFVRELVIAAESLASEAKVAADEAACMALRKQLDALVQGANEYENWLSDPRLCAALGAAYGELSDFDRAIGFYATARRAEKATFSVVMLEQLANLESRYAEHLWRQQTERTPESLADIDDRFKRADELLAHLLKIEASQERYSLLGGLEKRRAMTRRNKADRVKALEASEQHYLSAFKLNNKAFYPFVNAVVVGMARGWLAKTAKTQVDGGLSERVDRLKGFEADLKDSNEFWSLGFRAEAELLRRLRDAIAESNPGKSAAAIAAIAGEDLIKLFRDTQKRGRSHRELDSVTTQIRFLVTFAEHSRQTKVKEIRAALEKLATELAKR